MILIPNLATNQTSKTLEENMQPSGNVIDTDTPPVKSPVNNTADAEQQKKEK